MHCYKKKFIPLVLLIVSLYGVEASAQILEKFNIGVGLGIDYGGIGARATYQPVKRLGVFGSLGYNLNSAGYNVGAQLRFPTKTRVDWFISGMYGYNGVVKIKSDKVTKTTYYGPSLGGGIELKIGKNRKSFFSFELIVPFRPQAMDDAIHDLRSLGYTVQSPLPFAYSVGYHIKLK